MMTEQEKILFMEKLWKISKKEEIDRRPVSPEESSPQKPKKKVQKNG
jgi:hypothetical protein